MRNLNKSLLALVDSRTSGPRSSAHQARRATRGRQRDELSWLPRELNVIHADNCACCPPLCLHPCLLSRVRRWPALPTATSRGRASGAPAARQSTDRSAQRVYSELLATCAKSFG